MSDLPLVDWKCRRCGSDNVIVGAYAEWDKVTQSWHFELSDHADDDLCLRCYQTELDEVPLTDLKDVAAATLYREKEKERKTK